LACPYFVPRELRNDGSWPHPVRLPLGAGWNGSCCASGQETAPTDAAIREFCNLGNAPCPHLPVDRDWDAVRFSVASTGSEHVVFWYVCERAHAPVEHGKLTFDLGRRAWTNPHPDARVDRLASRYLEAWMMRQRPAAAPELVAIAEHVTTL